MKKNALIFAALMLSVSACKNTTKISHPKLNGSLSSVETPIAGETLSATIQLAGNCDSNDEGVTLTPENANAFDARTLNLGDSVEISALCPGTFEIKVSGVTNGWEVADPSALTTIKLAEGNSVSKTVFLKRIPAQKRPLNLAGMSSASATSRGTQDGFRTALDLTVSGLTAIPSSTTRNEVVVAKANCENAKSDATAKRDALSNEILEAARQGVAADNVDLVAAQTELAAMNTSIQQTSVSLALAQNALDENAADTAALEQAIADLEAALANCDTVSEQACKTDVAAAQAAVLAALADLGTSIDQLSQDIQDLMAQAEAKAYSGKMNFTVKDSGGNPVAGVAITEVNYPWAQVGQMAPRSCLTAADGTCSINLLVTGYELIFEAKKAGWLPQSLVKELDSALPVANHLFTMKAAAVGDLIGRNYRLDPSQVLPTVGHIKEVQADGTEAVATGVTCSIPAAESTWASVAGDCSSITAKAVEGCAHITATKGAETVVSIVRVGPAGVTPGTQCAP